MANYLVEFRESYETKQKQTMRGDQLAKLRVDIGSAPGSVLIRYQKTSP
jgi:hypothetical protein